MPADPCPDAPHAIACAADPAAEVCAHARPARRAACVGDPVDRDCPPILWSEDDAGDRSRLVIGPLCLYMQAIRWTDRDLWAAQVYAGTPKHGLILPLWSRGTRLDDRPFATAAEATDAADRWLREVWLAEWRRIGEGA